MDGRFEVRRAELLAQTQVSVEDWDGATELLETFDEPFVESLSESAQRWHFVEYASELLSNLEQTTGEGITYLHDQDRKQMQQFVGESPWEHAPLLRELARQVSQRLGEADGVKFQTRHEQALEIFDDCGVLLPHRWVTGDDEMGRCGTFREALRIRDEHYLLAIPSNTLFRDAEVPPPKYISHGHE